MVDIVEKSVRSKMMSSIRGKNTKPEMLLRRFLHARGYRYRLHVRALPGSPDLVLRKFNLIIFVHGCFWHQHDGCRYAYTPDEKRDKWQEKFAGTLQRDKSHLSQLMGAGWRVFIIWECGLTKGKPVRSLDWLPGAIADMEIQFIDWPTPYSDDVNQLSINASGKCHI